MYEAIQSSTVPFQTENPFEILSIIFCCKRHFFCQDCSLTSQSYEKRIVSKDLHLVHTCIFWELELKDLMNSLSFHPNWSWVPKNPILTKPHSVPNEFRHKINIFHRFPNLWPPKQNSQYGNPINKAIKLSIDNAGCMWLLFSWHNHHHFFCHSYRCRRNVLALVFQTINHIEAHNGKFYWIFIGKLVDNWLLHISAHGGYECLWACVRELRKKSNKNVNRKSCSDVNWKYIEELIWFYVVLMTWELYSYRRENGCGFSS